MLVNGLPAAGKTTLARSLARELGLPLFSKDAVKETLADTLAPLRPADATDRRWSSYLGRASGELLWTLLAEARGSAVLESPWYTTMRPLVRAGMARAGVDPADTVEVWCEVPTALARERFLARVPERHPVHPERPGGFEGEWSVRAETARPLDLGGEVVVVDTIRPVDVGALAEHVGGAPSEGAPPVRAQRRRSTPSAVAASAT
ncbi:AAA family ATPase [Streptacidiphilus monticola]|uniref:AAA family ATPase n=1 Tax=Streptacidiphilus monticola TaxID=2161674 RepID=A0ABW1G3R9_9ACTN